MLWRISLQWGRFYFPIIWQKAIARLDHLLCSFARFLLLGVSDFLWYLDPCGNWRRQMWYNSSPFQLFELSSNIKCSFHHIQCEPCIPRHFCHFPCSIFYDFIPPWDLEKWFVAILSILHIFVSFFLFFLKQNLLPSCACEMSAQTWLLLCVDQQRESPGPGSDHPVEVVDDGKSVWLRCLEIWVVDGSSLINKLLVQDIK